MTNRIGETLEGERGRYRIVATISSGGKNALLYEVVRIGSEYGSLVAKFFHRSVFEHQGPGLGTDAQRAFKRFKKEAKFLRLFDHPNIVSYEDQYAYMDDESSESDECFIAMEYLNGLSIESAILERSLSNSVTHVIRIAIGITTALVEMHRQAVVHRDLHPGNVFLENNEPKVIDFGCAVDLDPERRITRPHDYDGDYSPLAGRWHRAPEATNPTTARKKSDVFSLGLTILEMATKGLIHGHQTEFTEDIRSERVYGEIESLSGRFSADFCQLLRDMVHTNSYIRPTAYDVLQRLEGIQNRTQATAISRSTPTPSYPTSRTTANTSPGLLDDAIDWVKENPGKATLVGLGGLALLGLGAAWLTSDKPSSNQSSKETKSTVPSTKTVRAVALDLDNTIVHVSEEVVGDVVLPPGRVRHHTIELMKEIIKAEAPIILVTGRRASAYEDLRQMLPHTFAVFENGAVVFKSTTGQFDWNGNDAKKLTKLWELEERLQDKGYETNKDGRLASFRIVDSESEPIDRSKLLSLVPPEARVISNGPYLDFVLADAGKESAVRYLLAQLNTTFESTAAAGDDLNDLAMLNASGVPMTFRDAHPDVVEAVRKKKDGFVTEKNLHEGSAEILNRIKGLL